MSWRTNRFSSLAMVLLTIAVAWATTSAYGQQTDQPRRQQTQKPRPGTKAPAKTPPAAQATPAAKAEPMTPSQVGVPTLARHAFMVDPQTSTILLFKDADKPMPPSSMAKMMTIYLMFEDLASGKLKLDTRFKVSERAYAITRGVHSSTMFLELNSDVSVGDLIQGIIVDSGNDASVAVAEGMSGSEEAFAERMNRKAHELGLTGSVFKNASGWPAEGQFVTARDLALLAWRTMTDFPQYYPYYAQREFTFNGKTQPNRNLELKRMPGVDGLKTGHTEEGGYGQTTSAVRNGRRLILVINGINSMADRAQETTRLLEWGYREFTNTTIFRAGDLVAEAPVWLGVQDKVPLVISRAVQVTTPAGQTVQPRAVAKFDGPLSAPIVKGAKVGTVAVTLPDNRVVEYQLEAGADVARQGAVSRVVTLIRHYVFGWLS